MSSPPSDSFRVNQSSSCRRPEPPLTDALIGLKELLSEHPHLRTKELTSIVSIIVKCLPDEVSPSALSLSPLLRGDCVHSTQADLLHLMHHR